MLQEKLSVQPTAVTITEFGERTGYVSVMIACKTIVSLFVHKLDQVKIFSIGAYFLIIRFSDKGSEFSSLADQELDTVANIF